MMFNLLEVNIALSSGLVTLHLKYHDPFTLRRISKHEWKKGIGDDEKCTDQEQSGNKDNRKAV